MNQSVVTANPVTEETGKWNILRGYKSAQSSDTQYVERYLLPKSNKLIVIEIHAKDVNGKKPEIFTNREIYMKTASAIKTAFRGYAKDKHNWSELSEEEFLERRKEFCKIIDAELDCDDIQAFAVIKIR